MKKYVAIIGSMDDFNTHEDMIEYWKSGKTVLNGESYVPLNALEVPNFGEYSFEVPDNLDPNLISHISCGHFFLNDWSMDWTFSQTMVKES